MRAWTKSACVVLAWSFLPIILILIGSTGSVPPAHASTRTASSTQVNLTTLHNAPAAHPTAARPAVTRYVVQYGDTLTSIASRFGVHGGWAAVYAANRRAIGPDPNTIQPGTVLVLPSRTLPAHYTVVAGDTLSGIAARLALPGGWLTLYEANWQVIGPNPNTIQPGTVLRVPRPAAPAPPSSASGPAIRPQLAPAPPASAPTGSAYQAGPETVGAPNAARMPAWLKFVLMAVGLLVGLTFLAEALMMLYHHHAGGDAAPEPDPALPDPQRPSIIMADHDRLVVTCDKQADRVFVLRPPGEDPRAILRVARLVLPEEPYGQLARQLGLPAVGPVE